VVPRFRDLSYAANHGQLLVTERWREDYLSWGRTLRGRHQVLHPVSQELAAQSLAGTLPILAYGCGRSYGDAPLNPDGRLIDCRGLDRFIAFDRHTGILVCEAGVQLADILAILCQPEADNGGWFPPVVPGTRFVTVGGAIANDVHGKNQHRLGTFGCHVMQLELARSDGTRQICSRDQNAELFAATIGGIGLTGVILNATIQLQRVPGLAVEAEDIRFGNLEEFFALVVESDAQWDYTAAWVDSFATGRGLGRGIFSRARRVSGRAAWPPAPRSRTSLPPIPPISLICPLTARVFNAAYWRKSGGRGRSAHIGSYENVLFPLDAVANWNRVYGPKGFFQFQCVVPPANARDAVAELLRLTVDSAQGSFVTGLKTFSDIPSPGLMSFPMAGTSLALDVPNRGAATRQFLVRLEQVVLQAGGRIYPAKDATMSAASLRQGYPQISRFVEQIDPNVSSALARRLALTPPTSSEPVAMVSLVPGRRTVAIFGATSGIAMAVARLCAQAGDLLVLVGRDKAALSALAADLSVRGAAGVAVQTADFAQLAALPDIVRTAWERFDGIDVSLVAYAVQPNQPAAEQDSAEAEAALIVNFVSPAILLGELARRGKARGSGTIAAITSVAGDRGRKSNYIYGASKGGLHRLLEGMRHSLHAAGVNVVDIRPGFVVTKLTAHLDRRGPLWATPDRVAKDIFNAIASGRPVLYTPWFWRMIMVVVRGLPRAVFHRTSF
jgi:short-subunit dehydrogenase/FAD/FMN-containing dehydrogenase